MENALAPRISKEGNLIYPNGNNASKAKKWIGDNFGVPAPTFTPAPLKKKPYKYVMEVLYKDFSTRKYKIKGIDLDVLASEMLIGLKHIAWVDPNALALTIKAYQTDFKTGGYTRNKMLDCACFRVSPNKWQHLNSSTPFTINNPYR